MQSHEGGYFIRLTVARDICGLVHAEPFLPDWAKMRNLMVHRNTTVAEVIIHHFAGKVRHLIALVETLSLHSVPERVAQLILDYHGRNPSRTLVEFQETQEDLAQCIGASREAFSRALRLLADLGLLQSTFPVVRILDILKLQRYARG